MGDRDIATANFASRGSSEITACLRGVAADSRLHSATPELLQLLTPDSGSPSETDVIIDVKKIKPGSDIVSVWGEFLKRFVEMLAALVISRSAPAMIFRPV
jgi:hypothetical protein